MRLLRKCLCVVAIAIGCSIPQLGLCFLELTVVPASPRYLEPVYLRLNITPYSTALITGARVSMSGTDIKVEIGSVPDIAPTTLDVMLGRFPAGTYTVTVERFGVEGPTSTQFTVAQGPDPSYGPSYVGATLQSNQCGLNGCSGPVYRTTGWPFNRPFDPSLAVVRAVQVGDGWFSANAMQGSFSFTIDGVRYTKYIQRQPLD